MMRVTRGIVSAVACLLLAGMALAQEKVTTTEKRPFEVISIDGNKVVYRSQGKVREATLPADFKVTLDTGQEIGLSDVKPGMKGVALITTTTTTTPVTVTEVKNAEVLAVAANNIIVRQDNNAIKKYTVQDVRDRNVTILREGERVELNQLRPGDRLTATIITKKPPVVMTEAQVRATVKTEPAPASSTAAAPAPAPAPAAAPAQAPASTSASATTTKSKKLPKTGTHLPAVGWLAAASLAAAFGLTLRRRSR